MVTSAATQPFLLNSRDGRGVYRRQIPIDDAQLRTRMGAQTFAKQPLGSIGISERQEHEVNRGARRIDCAIQVAPAPFHLDVSLVDTPRLVGWLQVCRKR